MRPDLIVTWPSFCDYPLWRAQVERDRAYFGKVIVVFSPLGPVQDASRWVRENFDAEYAFAPSTGEWRNVAVNTGLELSDSPHVLFTEQDFFYEPGALARLLGRRAAGVHAGEARWHPCFLMAAREDIEQTSRDFGVTEQGDHFTKFGNELAALTPVADLGDGWFTHMQGLSEAQALLAQRLPVTFKPEQFADYLRACLAADVAYEPHWLAQAEAYLA